MNTGVRNLNQRYATNFVFDERAAARAHERARAELELLLDSRNEDDLHEAFDTFLDLLLECLIREKVIDQVQSNIRGQIDDAKQIRELLVVYGNVLAPLMLLDNWFRLIVFELTNRMIPTVFTDANSVLVRKMCLAIERDNDEARQWRRYAEYPPLD